MDHLKKKSTRDFKTGWLSKRGKFVKGWKRRFCVLTFNHKLEYYLDEERVNKQGAISIKSLRNCCRPIKRSSQTLRLLSCSPDNIGEDERTFYFETTHPKRKWEFLADDKQTSRDWMRAINLMYSDLVKSDGKSDLEESWRSSREPVEKKTRCTSSKTNDKTFGLNNYEPEVYIVTDEEFSDEVDSICSVNALTELRVAIDMQHGGNALKWTIYALAEKVPPETLFREFYRGQERPNWNSRFGGYWEEILSTLANAKIDPDCIVEERTFFHILAKDHHVRVYDALWSLGPSVNRRDERGLSALDYFLRTSTGFLSSDRWWVTFEALVKYGYQSGSLERSFRQLRYQIDQKKINEAEVMELVEKAEGFKRKWERDLQRLLTEIPSGYLISEKIGVNHVILQFCYGNVLDML